MALLAGIVCAADAREPVKGDYVAIGFSDLTVRKGTVTDISNAMICLENGTLTATQQNVETNFDEICIGIGQIQMLTWPSTSSD
jgi:hypothetical protein